MSDPFSGGLDLIIAILSIVVELSILLGKANPSLSFTKSIDNSLILSFFNFSFSNFSNSCNLWTYNFKFAITAI